MFATNWVRRKLSLLFHQIDNISVSDDCYYLVNMFDDIHAYFYESVLETYREYVGIKSSSQARPKELKRAAVNMASILYHLREQVPGELKKHRNALSQREPNYSLIGDIANVSKHKTIDRNSPRITDAENIFEAVVITQYRDDQGPYDHITKSVFATLDDKTTVDLHLVIVSVLNMWLEEFEQAGIIDHIQPFSLHSNRLPQRGEGLGNASITSIAGVRINQTFKFQKYNYETKNIELIDLTDWRFEGRIYERKYDITLNFVPKNNGSESPGLKMNLTLNGEQYNAIQECETDVKKMQLLAQIAQEQGKWPSSVLSGN